MEQISTKRVPALKVIARRYEGSYDDMGRIYHELRAWARQHKATVSGQGFTIFLSPPDEHTRAHARYEVCLPVSGPVDVSGEVELKEVPEADVAFVQVEGPYSLIPAHYAEILAWLDVNGMEIAGPAREVYLRRPDAHGGGDPKHFLTEIQIPIRV